MGLFEITVALLLLGAVLSAWARRLQAPYPAFLAIAGAALALIPGTPTLSLEPTLVLTLFVAPTLLDAAFDMSLRDLRIYWIPIAFSAVIAVVVTVAAVAVLARALRPDMSWPVAIALGAIVSPPDASAATAVLRALRPPHRVMVILEGESLLNDATALLIYRAAVLAAAGAWGGWGAFPALLGAIVGSAILGVILGALLPQLMRHITDVPTAVIVQFVAAFAVWIVADRLTLSPVITVVSFAITLAQIAPARSNATHRIPSYAVWDVAVFVLNVLAFIMAGLQLRSILTGLHSIVGGRAFGFAAAVLGVVVVVRLLWVMGYNTVARWRNRHLVTHSSHRGTPPTIGTGVVAAWSGMRGIVTLATALALPPGFPYRDLILLSAYGVVLGTLVVQGLSLRPLILALKLSDTGEVETEIKLARQRTAEAALELLAELPGPIEILREEHRVLLRQSAQGPAPEDDLVLAARQHVLAEQRRMLIELRAHGVIGDDAFHVVEEELDSFEFYTERRIVRLTGGSRLQVVNNAPL
jgi:CPA1 family monovalent cation:H+ antiporter